MTYMILLMEMLTHDTTIKQSSAPGTFNNHARVYRRRKTTMEEMDVKTMVVASTGVALCILA